MDQRERELLFLHVDSEGFSHVVDAEVEEIVADLERQPERLTEGPHPFDDGRIVGSAERARRGAGRDERGRLVRNDPEICLFVEVQVARLFDLKEFTLAHPTDGVRDLMQQGVLLPVEREQEAPAEQEVAEEDGDFAFPQGPDRELSPASGGFVDHVVVHERGRVQQFHQRGGGVRRLGDAAARLRAQQHENGADLLALAAKDVPRDAVEQPHV